MLNLRTDASDELRRPKTTSATANAPANVVTPHQLQFSSQPRSSAASRDAAAANLSQNTSNNSHRMPDSSSRLRAMSTAGDYDPLRRALTTRDRKISTSTVSPVAQGVLYNSRARSSDMETKTVMGRLKDREDRMRMSGEWRRRDQQESSPIGDDDHDDDDVLQELQLRMSGGSMGLLAMDDHRALAMGATSYKHNSPGFDMNLNDQYDEDYSDEDEDQHHHAGSYMVDTPELAAFLGLTVPQHNHHQQQPLAFPPPTFPKAASFSGHQQQRYSHSNQQQQQSQPVYLRGMVPCSPPVPIPRKQMRRRRNSVTGSLLTTSNNYSDNCVSHLSVAEDDMSNYYSRTQCEARLWDEDWHFKLSLEARESFEANNSNNTSSTTSSTSNNSTSASTTNSRGVWKPQSTVSMASTADTFRDEDESTGDSEDDEQVFGMDDL